MFFILNSFINNGTISMYYLCNLKSVKRKWKMETDFGIQHGFETQLLWWPYVWPWTSHISSGAEEWIGKRGWEGLGGKIRILYGVDCTRGLIDSLHVNFLAYSRHLINRRKPISFHSPPNNVELWTATISPKEYKILTIMSCFCPCVEGLSYCSDFSNTENQSEYYFFSP